MPKLSMLPTILAAAFAFAAGPGQAEMKSQWVEYSHGDTKLKAYMAYDDKVSGKRPAVLVVHAREGMTPKTQSAPPSCGRSSATCRSRPTFSATARACCRRMSLKCRRRSRSTATTAR